MNYSKDEFKLNRILNEIINSTKGLKYVIIIDDAGYTILSRSKLTFPYEDGNLIEKIGAIGCANFIAGEEQGQILGYGDTNLQITEYDEGMIFTTKVGKGILCLTTDNHIYIDYIRELIKKWAPQITVILQNYLMPKKSEMKKSLKELLNPNIN